MTAYLILGGLTLIACAVAYIFITKAKALKKELRLSQATSALLRHNIKVLGKHIHQLEGLSEEKTKFTERLSKSTTDEDLYTLLGDIINRNNDKRMLDPAKG